MIAQTTNQVQTYGERVLEVLRRCDRAATLDDVTQLMEALDGRHNPNCPYRCEEHSDMGRVFQALHSLKAQREAQDILTSPFITWRGR